jgi:glycosyltransferase involved in cell wall biosynthesis
MLLRLGRLAVPRGTRRERAAWLAWRSLVMLREGPRAWLTAARRELATMRARRHAQVQAAAKARTEYGGEVDVWGEPGLVSIVLPVYQHADLLPESIDSVLAQTWTDFELIVVDDGSTDGVERVLARYCREPRVRILTQPNQKLPQALSHGFAHARGELWTWTSADNVMEPRQLERLVAFLRAHPRTAMVYADYLAIDDHGAPLRDPSFRPHNRATPPDAAVRLPRSTAELNVVQDNFIGACFLYRGWVGRLLGDYDPELGVEDYDYWMRINDRFPIEHLGSDELLYRYRVHANTLNARDRELGIRTKVQRLMERERERAAFRRRPWRIVADATQRGWLSAAQLRGDRVPLRGDGVLRGDTVERLGGEVPAGDKVLVVAAARTVAALELPRGAESPCVAVVCGSDPEEVYDCRDRLAAPNVICFAPSHEVGRRAALFTRQVHGATPGAALMRLATAFADDATLRRRNRMQQEAARAAVQPRVFTAGERPLRVLVQVDDFDQGGLEQVVLDQCAVFARCGIEPTLLLLGREGVDAQRARELGIAVERADGPDRDAAYRQLVAGSFDAVIAHHSVAGADLAHAAGVPFVQVVHNTYVWLSPNRVAAYRAADPFTAAYLCVSGNVARYADLALNLTVDKMVVAPNGVEIRVAGGDAVRERAQVRAELGLDPGDFAFLNVASLYPPKAQRIAVRALAEVRRKRPRARLVLLGRTIEQDYADLVRRETAELGLENAVVFAGYRSEAGPCYRAADAFLLPSYWEGWSLAVAEAALAGLPAVLSDVGGAREQLPALGGELVAPPFASVTELDGGTIGRLVHRVQDDYVAKVAAAMERVLDGRMAVAKQPGLAQEFDRERAYSARAELLRWIAAGGHPTAFRGRFRHLAAAGVNA